MRVSRFAIVALALAFALAGGACAPEGSEPTSPSSSGDIAVALHADATTVDRAVEAFALKFVVSNLAAESRHVLVYRTPLDGIDADILEVERDGVPVPYQGKIVKLGAPQPEDFVEIAAGDTLTVTFDPSAAYDMSLPGSYTVRYRAPALVAKAPGQMLLRLRASEVDYQTIDSDTVTVALKGHGETPSERVALEGKGGGGGGGGACSTTQAALLATAKANALMISTNARNSLDAASAARPEALYTTWFGASTTGRYATVSAHYTAIADAFATKTVTFDCSCRKKTYYAYVYPNDPYKIYLCGYYWVAPATGTDSKAGTLVHEMSHFDVVASTDDFVYGESGAAALAISNPDQAIFNADNHEYFAENHFAP